MGNNRSFVVGIIILIVLVAVGQALAYFAAPEAWAVYASRLPVILAQIGFWGPICALFSVLFVMSTLRLLGFESLEEIRKESVEQNNPTPAIVFVGTLIASILFLTLVIKP